MVQPTMDQIMSSRIECMVEDPKTGVMTALHALPFTGLTFYVSLCTRGLHRATNDGGPPCKVSGPLSIQLHHSSNARFLA